MIARKVMWATIQPHATTTVKETDLISFYWEEKIIQQLTEEEEEIMLMQQSQSEEFFAKWDRRKAGEE